MSGVFRNIDPPPPSHPASVYPPPPRLWSGRGHTRLGERGWGVNSSEDARHCSILYICKYFVVLIQLTTTLILDLTATGLFPIQFLIFVRR
jgi:hypothetical protein